MPGSASLQLSQAIHITGFDDDPEPDPEDPDRSVITVTVDAKDESEVEGLIFEAGRQVDAGDAVIRGIHPYPGDDRGA